MDYKKSTRLLEELLGLKVSIDGGELVLSDGEGEFRVKYGYAPLAIALFMPRKKALAALKALSGDQEAYREYLSVPMRACWLTRAVASEIARALAGRPRGDKLEEEVAKRWPNVCGNVDAFSEALKLVTALNEKGITATFKQEEKEGIINTTYGSIRIKKSSPEDLRFLKEMRSLLEEDKDLVIKVIELLSEGKGCFDLAEAVALMEDKLVKYGMIRAKLREKAEEMAKDLLFKAKRF